MVREQEVVCKIACNFSVASAIVLAILYLKLSYSYTQKNQMKNC